MRLLTLMAGLLLVAGTASAFESGNMIPGATFSYTFDEVFEDGHHYHCDPHPWMKGMVHVGKDTDGTTEEHVVDILEEGDAEDWGYSIEHLYIEVGDTVTWRNTGQEMHTVSETVGEAHAHHADHGDHDHGSHDHDDGATQDSSGVTPLLLLLGLALWAARRR